MKWYRGGRNATSSLRLLGSVASPSIDMGLLYHRYRREHRLVVYVVATETGAIMIITGTAKLQTCRRHAVPGVKRR
jgi:hypothetical protein